MKRAAGFTLIETLVTAVIALIIPAVVIAVLKVSSAQLSENSVGLRLTQIADGVSESIHRAALKATYVYEWNEGSAGCPVAVNVAVENLTGVVFCDDTRAIIAGFRVIRLTGSESYLGKLQEWKAGGAWSDITYSSDVVKVTIDNLDHYSEKKRNGLFGIRNDGFFFWYNMRFNMSIAGVRDSLPLQTQSAVCRNAPSVLDKWK